MKIRFSALYPETDTSFSVHHELYKLLRDKLNALDKKIVHFSEHLSDDFTLNIIISATRKNSALVVNGPILLKKQKSVEFVPKIPYLENMSFKDQVIYVFDNLELSVLTIFEKYSADTSGISDTFSSVKSEYLSNEEKYKC